MRLDQNMLHALDESSAGLGVTAFSLLVHRVRVVGAHRGQADGRAGAGLETLEDEKPLENGAPDTIRTCGLCLRRAALYPAELRVQRSAA